MGREAGCPTGEQGAHQLSPGCKAKGERTSPHPCPTKAPFPGVVTERAHPPIGPVPVAQWVRLLPELRGFREEGRSPGPRSGGPSLAEPAPGWCGGQTGCWTLRPGSRRGNRPGRWAAVHRIKRL